MPADERWGMHERAVVNLPGYSDAKMTRPERPTRAGDLGLKYRHVGCRIARADAFTDTPAAWRRPAVTALSGWRDFKRCRVRDLDGPAYGGVYFTRRTTGTDSNTGRRPTSSPIEIRTKFSTGTKVSI